MDKKKLNTAGTYGIILASYGLFLLVLVNALQPMPFSLAMVLNFAIAAVIFGILWFIGKWRPR